MRTSIMTSLFVIGAAMTQLVSAEDWVVPAEEAAKTNPIEVNAESIAQGKALYAEHCADCHGATGVGDGDGALLLGLELESLLSPAVTSQSDGVLYYKTAIGRGDMPGYTTDENLTPEQIWKLVIYMRSLMPEAE